MSHPSGHKKRTSQRVDRIAGIGFARFLKLLHSMSKEGLISLSVGEPDFGTATCVCEAAAQAASEGWTKYTPTSGFPELRKAIAANLKRRHGLDYDPESEIIVTVGVSQAMDLGFRALLDPGDEVITPDPHYICYPPNITLSEGVTVRVPTYQSEDYALEPDEMEKKITPRTKVLLFGNPANPTGALMEKKTLDGVARIADKHDLVVIADEIYSSFIYGGARFTSFATLPGMKERTLLLDGFSKRYGMPGWRLGYAAGPSDIITAMLDMAQHTMLCPPNSTQWAALAALNMDDEADFARIVSNYDQRRILLHRELNRMGLTTAEPKGAFYIFPDVSVTGFSSEEFCEKLLLEEKVMVLPGDSFGDQGKDHIRICYATPYEGIKEALQRIERFVNTHRK
ncbi:MAG: pyridoxal phosphate-dependent aminotransferase [Dehalococcoidia bacterium]|nr:pyridoxal phosphate-dependent aminotransferase [Dehalococcoidia bacterium]